MKKRLFSLILALVLVLSAGAPAYAGGAEFIFDYNGNTTNSEEMNLLAQEIYDSYGVAVCYASCTLLDGMTLQERARKLYDDDMGYTAGVMVFDCDEADRYYIYASDGAAEYFDSSDLDTLLNAYIEPDYYNDAVEAYLNKASELLADREPLSPAAEQPSASVRTIPAERQLPRVVDQSGVIDGGKLAELNSLADSVSEKYRCDVAVAFVSGTDGMNIRDYADDFFDYNGYGYGPDDDGAMLVVDTVNRETWLTVHSYGAEAFTDAGQSYVHDRYLPYLRDNDWSGAAEAFITVSAELLDAARNGNAYDVNNMPRQFSPLLAALSVLFGALLALIPVGIMKRQLKTVDSRAGAEEYTIPGSFRLDHSADRYLYRNVSRTARPQDNDSSSGGTSMHTSSSGESHGGSGRSF